MKKALQSQGQDFRVPWMDSTRFGNNLNSHGKSTKSPLDKERENLPPGKLSNSLLTRRCYLRYIRKQGGFGQRPTPANPIIGKEIMSEDKCLRCGQCCYMPNATGLPSTTPCRHLCFHDDGTTSCAVYETRIGTRLTPKVVCGERRKDRYDYEGCPYNTGSKPVYRVSRQEVRRIFTVAATKTFP